MSDWDCIVVGAGSAGFCAALAAKQAGCQRVLIVEKSPESWVGGNGFFTAGAFRTVHNGLPDLLALVKEENLPPGISPETIDIEPYTESDFKADIMKTSGGVWDEPLVDELVNCSRDAVAWLGDSIGVPFRLSFHRQAYEVGGRHKFWGGMALCTLVGGKGLIAAQFEAAKKTGISIWFDSPVVELLSRDQGGRKVVFGVRVARDGGEVEDLMAPSVVLAAGGFEASPALRVKYLGPGWDQARVRGTPYNTGDGFALADAVGARRAGDWKGCHATCWDAYAAKDTGDRELSNQYTKSGYPLGIMVNKLGQRFVDEGEDFRNFTYAKFGKAILEQPGGYAFQVWDGKTIGLLRTEEYGDDVLRTKVTTESLDELAQKMAKEGLQDQNAFLQTVKKFNGSLTDATAPPVDSAARWDPSIKDGVSTGGRLSPPKSNWALPISQPPFLAVKVACGITFTFGGLAIDPDTAGVLHAEQDDHHMEQKEDKQQQQQMAKRGGGGNNNSIIEGLFCTGEMIGGLWYGNYPGGSGLTAGAVFGRKAGLAAASRAGGGPVAQLFQK